MSGGLKERVEENKSGGKNKENQEDRKNKQGLRKEKQRQKKKDNRETYAIAIAINILA